MAILSAEFGFPLEVLQKEFDHGYTASELRNALSVANSSKQELHKQLKFQKQKPATAVQATAPALVNEIGETTRPFLKDQSEAQSLTAATDTSLDPTQKPPSVQTQMDKAPYQVILSTSNVSPLYGEVTVKETDMTLIGRNGLDFTLTRTYQSGESQYFGTFYQDNAQSVYKYYVNFSSTVTNEALGYRKTWTKVEDIEKDFNGDGIADEGYTGGAHVASVTDTSEILYTDDDSANLDKKLASKTYYPRTDAWKWQEPYTIQTPNGPQSYPGYYWRYYWTVDTSTIVDNPPAENAPIRIIQQYNTSDRKGPYDQQKATDTLHSLTAGTTYSLSSVYSWNGYKAVRSRYQYATPLQATISTESAGSTHNATKTTYQEQMFPIGTGWSWNIPSIEWDTDVGTKYLHLGEQGTYVFAGDYDISGFKGDQPVINYSDYSPELLDTWPNFSIKFPREGKKYFFDKKGKIQEIQDDYGNYILFKFSEVAPYGNVLTQVTNSIGNTMNISYSTSEVRLTQGARTVVYSKGITTDIYKKEYLASVKDEAGRVEKYGYDFKPALFSMEGYIPTTSNPYALLTQVNHPTGAQTLFQYEDSPVTRSYYDRVNQAYRVHAVSNQISYLDGSTQTFNQNTLTYTGDIGQSSKVSTTLSNGLTNTTYDYERVGGAVLGSGQIYNKKITTTDTSASPTVTVITNEFDQANDIPIPTKETKQVTQGGRNSEPVTISRTFDKNENLLTETDPFGKTTTNTYDTKTHRLKTTKEQISSTQTITTTFERNEFGKPTKITTRADADQRLLKQEIYDYDSFGNITAVHQTDGTRDLRVASYEYSSAAPYFSAFVTKKTQDVTDVDGVKSKLTETYEYDTALGKMTKSTDGRSNSTTYQYDILGRLKKQTNPDLSTVTLTYDDLNNNIEMVNETGLKTRIRWNQLGQKAGTDVFQNGAYQTTVANAYDSYGRLVSTEDANHNITQTAYDLYGRPELVTLPDRNAFRYTYDDVAHTKTTIDPEQNKFRETYDKQDRLTKKELLKATDAVLLTQNSYDWAGNLVSVTDANQRTTKYQYDALKQLTAVTDASNTTTNYSYDVLGHMTLLTYADNSTVQKKYDEAGRLLQQTDSLGQVQKYYYDANGNLIRQVDRNGKTTTLTYNSRNQLMTKTPDAATSTTPILYEYDLSGRRTKMTDETGTTSYSYNAVGKLDTVTYPDAKTLKYTYDANGNVVTLQEPFGKTITNDIDNRNRLQDVKIGPASATPEVQYTYKKNGAVATLQLQNGMTTSYDYNEFNFVKSEVQKKADSTVTSTFAYTYDLNNNQTSKTENAAQYNFGYDALNRISTSSQFNEAYTYDSRGNRQTQQSDKLNLPSLNVYEYDGYNQLKKVTTPEGKVVTYKYNGDGLMTERTENGVTTRYYYDGSNIIAEATVTNGTSSLKARYYRGQAGQLISREDANGTKAFYSLNGHGDVTELRDSTGNVLNTYTYDIWGNPQTAQESVSNPFRYSGEFWDDVTQLQYLRARWYNPQSGRFVNEDGYEGQLKDPMSLNLYTYVESNPLTYWDPSGNTQVVTDTASDGWHPDSSYDWLLDTPNQILIHSYQTYWQYYDSIGDIVQRDSYATLAGKIRSNPCSYAPGGCNNIDTVVAQASFIHNPDGAFAVVVLYTGYTVVVNSVGQIHHLLSNKIMKALNDHAKLRGIFNRNDPDLMYRAADEDSHKGYQSWHREYDEEVVKWLTNNPGATKDDFLDFLQSLYERPEIKARIPGVNVKKVPGDSDH
ncbi:hypothetical protein EL26_22300 [Tumebacillus flagellatus]|uniref:Teneurin-like YD-shell domain-containing protein n=1 Tax=Tumebacillus flagellatus TaxID=1157490 RepID=A0A074LKW7_9BACL|nr:hypothetical protein EL26_22300 [Tumebacillus flagellatus]